MTEDGDSVQRPPSQASPPTITVRKTRSPTRDKSPETSSTSLPLPTTTGIATRAATLASAISRSASPNGRLSLSLSRLGRSSVASSLGAVADGFDDTRTLIVRAFSPVVAVYASEDTDKLAQRKGFRNGFAEMLRPFGERISGKVVVRDSVGASRAWDDFGIFLLDLGRIVQDPTKIQSQTVSCPERLEELLEQYIEASPGETDTGIQGSTLRNPAQEVSPYYRLFLGRLLSVKEMSSHETFVHPVACVIAISSSTPSPIERLRQLYSQTAQGNRALPSFANPEYLRYYVLVHDEDRDDFSKSSALFDQMKRHFGLHCHLLRIRSELCVASDDGAVEVPSCEWMSPVEDLARLEETSNLLDDSNSAQSYLLESDIQAVNSFIRELTAQSVIPHMENRIALWNDQIASRRRGLQGRFMSLSKRWGGLSLPTSRSSTPNAGTSPAGASGNYDVYQGLYRYDAPEALLRKLADFAFMLRDYKLAASIYELLRTDYGNDKAWKYLAGANEMCMAASLLNPLGATAKTFRVDTFDQMLETATYSYLTRCEDPGATLRCILLGVELLKVRGKAACEVASKWAIKVLETGLVGQGGAGHVLLSERVASCFAGQVGSGTGSVSWGTRKRKAALWSVMAADEWLKLGKAGLASERLDNAARFYDDARSHLRSSEDGEDGTHRHINTHGEFKEMTEFISQLQLAVKIKLGQARRRGASDAQRLQMDIEDAEQDPDVQVDTMAGQLEQLDFRTNRRSVIPGNAPDMIVPLSPTRTRQDPLVTRDDDFE